MCEPAAGSHIGNEAAERGDMARAEECWAKCQFRMDRYNLLAGKSDKPAPRE